MKTLKEKIKVMQAALDGKEVEYSEAHTDGWYGITVDNSGDIGWAWNMLDYRIKPEPLEFWVNVYEDSVDTYHETEEDAVEGAERYVALKCKTIKVREVTE